MWLSSKHARDASTPERHSSCIKDRFTHIVPGPISVRVQEDGVRKSVEIQESGGSTMVLQFHIAPMLENARI